MYSGIHDLENRLHHLGTGINPLRGFWAEFEGYTGVSAGQNQKLFREFHKRYEAATTGIYVSGILS